MNAPSLQLTIGLLAELTHRCPLRCPYCSNPLELDRRSAELDTETWKRVLSEAARLGVLHVHLSGGEPAPRRAARDRPRGAGLLRDLPEGLRGRLGAAAHERDARRQGAALPRGR